MKKNLKWAVDYIIDSLVLLAIAIGAAKLLWIAVEWFSKVQWWV